MLLGFGVAIRLDSYGVDIYQVLHGPTDYLAAAVYAIAELPGAIGNADRTPVFWLFALPAGAVVFAGVVLAISTAFTDKPISLQSLKPLAKHLQRLNTNRRQRLSIGTKLIGLGTLFAISPFLLLTLFVYASSPVLIGYVLAGKYFDELTAIPKQCRPLRSATMRRSELEQPRPESHKYDEPSPETTVTPSDRVKSNERTANCLKVTTKDGNPIFGRRVIATSESVVLFDPGTGAVHVVPTKDAVVTLVPKLPDPADPSATTLPATPQKSAMATRHPHEPNRPNTDRSPTVGR